MVGRWCDIPSNTFYHCYHVSCTLGFKSFWFLPWDIWQSDNHVFHPHAKINICKTSLMCWAQWWQHNSLYVSCRTYQFEQYLAWLASFLFSSPRYFIWSNSIRRWSWLLQNRNKNKTGAPPHLHTLWLYSAIASLSNPFEFLLTQCLLLNAIPCVSAEISLLLKICFTETPVFSQLILSFFSFFVLESSIQYKESEYL